MVGGLRGLFKRSGVLVRVGISDIFVAKLLCPVIPSLHQDLKCFVLHLQWVSVRYHVSGLIISYVLVQCFSTKRATSLARVPDH